MDAQQIIDRGGRRWLIRPAATVLQAEGWPTDHPERLVVVKRSVRRTVYRFEAAGHGYYLKTYLAAGPWRLLRARLGLGPGRREWNALLAAQDTGLDVPEPIALALGPQETIITREVPGGQRLDEYLFERYFEPRTNDPPYPGARPPELVAAFRQRRTPPPGTIDPRLLAYRLADLLARLDEADLYLPDLHPGNLLISGEGGSWRLTLLDLAEAVRPAPPEAMLHHIVQLEHFFEPIASAAERLRCLARLRELADDVPRPAEVARATAAYRRHFYLGRDRRSRRSSKYFRRIRAGGWRGWAASDWAAAVESLLAAYPDSAPPIDPAAVIKKGRTSTVWRVRLPDGRSLIAKRHNRASDRPVLGRLRTSRSIAAMRKGHALLVRGILAARPAAAADLLKGGRRTQTLLLTEPVEGVPLSDWLRNGPTPADRRRLTWRLARLIRRMHEAGLSHRDLKAPNILVVSEGRAAPRPVLVDVDGLSMRRRVSVARRAQNLMRLSVSLDEWGVARRTDRLRFLKAYLSPPGCARPITILHRRRGPPDHAERMRRWWNRIAALSARKWKTLRRKNSAPL